MTKGKEFYYKILSYLPTKVVLYLEHFRGYRKILNLRNPKYFGEKIQWIKLYGNLEQYSSYVDKFEVREFVSKIIGDKYLNRLIGVYNSSEEIDFHMLPEKFVLKVTHGCGFNIICKEKNKMDVTQVKNKLDNWMRIDFSKIKKEPQYANIKT